MMMNMIKLSLAMLFAIAIFPAFADAQSKNIKSLTENASLSETQKWLVHAVRRYATYKTPAISVTITDVKFDGCSMSTSLVRKGAVPAQQDASVVSRVQTSTQEAAFHFSFVEPDGITTRDHTMPDFKLILIRFRADASATPSVLSRDHEIVVRREAAEAIRSALMHARKLCTAKS